MRSFWGLAEHSLTKVCMTFLKNLVAHEYLSSRLASIVLLLIISTVSH